MAFADYNPFKLTATLTRSDFVMQPFYETNIVKQIKAHIQSDIWAIQNNHRPYTRVVFLGHKGVGKTSVLFYIQDLLKQASIMSIIIDSFPASLEELKNILKMPELKEYLKDHYLYILLDHPDEVRKRKWIDHS